MTQSLKELGTYWDRIASKNVDLGMLKISDNWLKRRQIVQFLLGYSLKEKDRVLEIGAGLGTTIDMLARLYGAYPIDYVSTDTSPRFQEAMIKLRERPCSLATIDDLPFEDEEFNWVWLFDVLEHVEPAVRKKAGQEVGRVLSPNGLIFINNPLCSSSHDNAFDFGFSQVDIGNFCHETSTVIRSVDIHASFKNRYQFIVLEKVNK